MSGPRVVSVKEPVYLKNKTQIRESYARHRAASAPQPSVGQRVTGFFQQAQGYARSKQGQAKARGASGLGSMFAFGNNQPAPRRRAVRRAPRRKTVVRYRTRYVTRQAPAYGPPRLF